MIGTVIQAGCRLVPSARSPRIAGVILVYLLLLILLTGFLLLLFPLIVEQSTKIAAAVPGYYQNLREWMVSYPNQLIVRLSEFLPATLPSLNPRAAQQTGQDVMASAGQALGYITLAARVIFTAIVVLVLAFYWTLDGPRIIQSFLLLVPQDRRSISELISTMETKVGFYIAGQGILCLHLIYCHRDRHGDSTSRGLVVSARTSPDCRGHSCLPPAAAPARRLPAVVISVDHRAKYNGCCCNAGLLPKPARVDG